MGLGIARGKFGAAKTAYTQRRDERYKTETLRCHVGRVVELSQSGMRVCCKEKPPFKKGGIITFGITAGTQRLPIEGCVVWMRRASWRSSEYELGVQFRDQRPAVRAALAAMAQFGFVATGGASSRAQPGGGGAYAQEAAANAGAASSVQVEVEDLYAVMGLQPSATDDQIRSAFRTLARELHPDVSRDDAAQEKFMRVTKAYSVLRDPVTRKRYDELVERLRAA
jgi:DnaJ-domain-containing protein 1